MSNASPIASSTRAAELEIIADAAHAEDLGVPAGGEEQAIGKRRRVGQPRGQRMGFEVIDRDQRLVVGQRDRLGHGQPDDEAADQTRPGGRRDAVERREADIGLRHRLGDDEVERFDMGAGGDLGHDAAERGMLVDLRQHDVGQNAAALAVRGEFDHGGGGFVAGRFDAEHDHDRFRRRSLHYRNRCLMTASCP